MSVSPPRQPAAPQGESARLVNITVNGGPQRIASGASLADVLAALGHAPASVATAVNGEFVPRAARAAHVLNDGDQLTCFQPIVGG